MCIDTMPVKGYRDIKDSSAIFESLSTLEPSEVEAVHFRSFHSQHVALYFCSSASRRESFRPESLQLSRCGSVIGCARTERIPIIRCVRAQTVEGTRSRVLRLRDRNDIVSASSRN